MPAGKRKDFSRRQDNFLEIFGKFYCGEIFYSEAQRVDQGVLNKNHREIDYILLCVFSMRVAEQAIIVFEVVRVLLGPVF